MGPETSPNQETIFVFRRLSEALHLGSKEIDGHFWLLILVPVLLAGLFYVGWMYVRDGRSVGWPVAAFLATLRCVVYALLALIFLLPGNQVWDRTETHSKVVILFDVSGSMESKDDIPTETLTVDKLLSRQDKIIRFLTDEQVAWLKRLQDQNPVTIYKFGTRLDEEFKNFGDKDRPPTTEEWAAWLKPDVKIDIPNDGSEENTKLRKRLDELREIIAGTNVPESVQAVLNREGNNMLQGIIVITDGHNTQSSVQTIAQTLADVRARADKSRVPIFTVGVGEYRQPVSIRITDVQAPEQARPDDRFPVRVDIDGEGLADADVDVSLDVTKPDGTKITLKPTLKPGETARFKPGEPPHIQVEFEVDKPEVEGDWKVVARVPKDRREPFVPSHHVSDPTTVVVVKKPLRVLLFAGAPTRDYQFLRALMVREVDRRRAELSVFLQLARPDIVQDVPAERLLRRFPGTYHTTEDPKEKIDEKYDNLAQYDLVIAFDPDWTQLSREQMATLESWVERGGGLIVVGGPINTYQLARGINYDQVKPILDMYPVLLEDSRRPGMAVDRPSTEPWRLNFPGASPEMEFLKLDEEIKEPLAGWEEFFTGQQKGGGANLPLRRGFYNFYPLKGKKTNALVVATFTDPRARLADGGEQPFLVTMPYKRGKVVYLGSGEIWRLRQFREAFHERFWTKLARYAGSANMSQLKTHGDIVMSTTFTAGNPARVEAHLFGPDMKALPRGAKPVAQIKSPQGVAALPPVQLQPKPSGASDWDGWFAGRFPVTSPGTYELQLQVPGTPDLLSRKFVVKDANPETDNTRPDFNHLRQLASRATEVLERVKEDRRDPVKAELQRTNKFSTREGATEDKESVRLFFDVKAAEVIPDCMKSESKTRKSLGAIQDLWDAGFQLPIERVPYPNSLFDWYWKDLEQPLKLSYAFLTIVGLLSIEWLTRKLLKLA